MIPPQPNRASPATDFQPKTPKKTRSALDTPAPSFSIRLPATVHPIIAAKPIKVVGVSTA